MKQRKNWILWVLLTVLVGALLTGCSGNKSAADKWPERPITMINIYAPGGAAELMMRALAIPLEKELGKSIVITSKPGGGGAIGTVEMLKSKPDGYTFSLMTIGTATLVPQHSNVGYTNKEFAPVAQIADTPTMFSVRKDHPANTVQEFFEMAKKNPGKMTYASSGAGLIHNVMMEGVQLDIGQPGIIAHVPFTGGAEAVTAVLAGQVDGVVGTATEHMVYLKSGDLKPLAVSSTKRYSEAPNVPTFKEAGFNVDVGVWFGITAPKGTPEAVIKKMEAALQKAVNDPNTVQLLAKANQPLEFLSTKDFTEKWMRDFDKNKKVVDALKQQPKK